MLACSSCFAGNWKCNGTMDSVNTLVKDLNAGTFTVSNGWALGEGGAAMSVLYSVVLCCFILSCALLYFADNNSMGTG